MNNIKSFSEYTGQELETIVYDNELNEGVRSFLNKMVSKKVKAQLSDEIEMSKSIMDGIKNGLESLNENFDILRKEFKDSDDNSKGEKQKTLDSIMKIIEDSKKNTWDLKELIDEGEIDYTGFTANVGIASAAYFGILFTPFRASVIIHKGYNYFFNIVKNTIRKALVMLQLNYDQFENLIITKGFQSMDYLQDKDTSVKVSEFYGKLEAKLFDKKSGMLVGKKGGEYAKHQMQLAKQQIDAMMKADKNLKLSDNAYNCLDQYNNTYTKSLETLRQYSADDVQKHLDAIKTSMSKLAGQEADLQTYSELIIAAAEEHAYKVSSSIYNKFAKMTEVFSLPNQKKMIDLIQEATKEEMDEAEKREKNQKNEENVKKMIEERDKTEKEGLDIFKSLDGVEISDIDEETKQYKDIKADNWTYDEYDKLNEDDRISLEKWLYVHPEVVEKCNETLRVIIDTNKKDAGYYDYIDSLVDYIGPCIESVNEKKKKKNESYILKFDEFICESKTKYELSDEEKEELENKISEIESDEDLPTDEDKTLELFNFIFGTDFEDLDEDDLTDETRAKLQYIIDRDKESGVTTDDDELYKKIKNFVIDYLESKEADDTDDKKPYIDFDDLDKVQVDDIKDLYDDKEVATIALKTIGEKILKDKTFVKNSKYIVDVINKCIDSKKEHISYMIYLLLIKSIKSLDELRSHDYATIENEKKSDE